MSLRCRANILRALILLPHPDQSNRRGCLIRMIWQFGPISGHRSDEYGAATASVQSDPDRISVAILVRKIQKCYGKALMIVTI